ncbi:DNA-directed RNA polymerase I subunit RPA1 [Aplysia californica]|uniref:DNA-directed RNA polymerase subunit n=1 Tax=Aplysia californica TaxID=6500 RepID=A0ABM0JU50_APLCA|nr:DNA-directed RNA polymerase I subunit RPA1 [Aplysia californica]
MEVPHMKVDQTDFRIYSKEEILQLSVKEIVNPQTFDLLENPVHGGLHDPALGPCRHDDRCESCGQSEKNCPGHMGHITLPVLLYNPLLFKTLVKVLRGSCLSCHRINMPTLVKQVYTSQIQLLENGFLTEAQELVERFSHSEKAKDIAVAEVEAYVLDVLRNSDRADHSMSKNKLTQIKNTVNTALKSLTTVSSVCCHCETQNRSLKPEYNHSIIGTKVEARKSLQAVRAQRTRELSEEHEEENGGNREEEVVMEGDNEEKEQDKDPVSEDISLDKELQTQMDHFLNSKHKRCILYPNVAKEHMKMVWEYEKEFLSKILPFLTRVHGAEVATEVFFMEVLPVPPTRFRPLSVMKERKYEHPQTANLANVLRGCVEMREMLRAYSKRVKGTVRDNVQGLAMGESSDSLAAHMHRMSQCWVGLQSKVNVVLDSDLDNISKEKFNGVKQLLEKKEGLFRMHMMGKRVNFAARSVISPDPYIGTKEVGIPLVFASKLTYPHRVTPWNVQQLRQMVINGPNNYPGAVSVINEDGSVVRLSPTNETQREAIAKQLLVPDNDHGGSKTVCRHLINGDYLLLNRQPTLHRVSIQAHKARVLPNIKTLRMHYSNCKAYNADFDGDEMNAHFPQCELSRAEAEAIVCTDHQYLAPRDGAPLAGLIQDHMVAGVALTIRGRFFTHQDYCGLVWSAMNDWKAKIRTVPPAILKPQRLWSGKQIITTILLNIIPKDKTPLNLQSRAKIPEKNWAKWNQGRTLGPLSGNLEELGESTVIVSEGELLQGVLDKAHYGPSAYGLVHCCYELYGGEVAGLFLTYLGRLFTSFLQRVGFSLGAGDILVQKKANKKRKSIIKKSLHLGREAVKKGLGLSDCEVDERQLLLELKRAHFDKGGSRLAEIDMSMKNETDKVQDGIAKCIMPGGLEKGFPDNSLQLMVQSGAKGSPVNCMQISCLLGQIELEGRRPPLMLSGRSLPSFLPYDVSPKAGGFVTGRFLTGIRPQEYFFHCMAGREGLIDTAVKTSRSGYLQRCLVKHLEGITVNYDMTVRDSDGSLVQFYYGEDGIEPARNPYLKPALLRFLTQNVHTLIDNCSESPWLNADKEKNIKRTWKKISKWMKTYKEGKQFIRRESGFLEFCKSDAAPPITSEDKTTLVTEGRCVGRAKGAQILTEAWANLNEEKRKSLCTRQSCPDPVMSRYLPHSQPDVFSEKLRHDLNVYIKKGFEEEASKMRQKLNPESFRTAINKKVVQSMAHPGEGVGLVLAQSIGEPSTQMTLNTFHFAGRGEMNVTLGIPRLREILMTGSQTIKTPSMDIPVQAGEVARTKAQWLQRHLNMVTLDQLLQSLRVRISTRRSNSGNQKLIEAKFKFLPQRDFSNFTNLSPRAIVKYIVKKFIPRVNASIQKERKLLEQSSLLSRGKMRRSGADSENDSPEETTTHRPEEEDDVEVEPNDGDMSAVKEHQRQLDTQEYEGEDEERNAVIGQAQDEDLVVEVDPADQAEETDQLTSKEDGEGSSEEEAEMTGTLSKVDKDLKTEALSHDSVEDFKFSKKFRWCTLTFKYDHHQLQLDVQRLFERAVKSSVLHRVTGINRAFLSEVRKDMEPELHLKTDGINIQEMFKYPDILDLNQLHCNCIHTMASTYGIEAAYRVVIREIQDVFGAYGITVDYRHLSLLADFMTCRGEYDAFNRRDINYNTSPLQKMTFETTMNFLLDACLSGSVDTLKSPSAQLVMGRPMGVGTGSFEVLDPQ